MSSWPPVKFTTDSARYCSKLLRRLLAGVGSGVSLAELVVGPQPSTPSSGSGWLSQPSLCLVGGSSHVPRVALGSGPDSQPDVSSICFFWFSQPSPGPSLWVQDSVDTVSPWRHGVGSLGSPGAGKPDRTHCTYRGGGLRWWWGPLFLCGWTQPEAGELAALMAAHPLRLLAGACDEPAHGF